VAKKEGEAEVVVIDERLTTTYPQPDKPFYTVIVTFRKGDALPRTIFIPMSDVAKGREADLYKQYLARKGDFYNVFLAHRAKKIREDLEKIGAFKPETVRI